MATTIDFATGIISVQQADLTLITGTLYEMDTNAFRLELKALEAGEIGIVFTDTNVHNTEVTVAGITFARTIEILRSGDPQYSVQFLPDAQWSVRFTGSNNNIFDVESGILIQNQVQVIPANSAGLQSFPSKDLSDIKFLVESLRPHHTGQGTVFYWNPDTGDDGLSGLTQAAALKTFAQAHSLATSGAHDIIVALSGVIGTTTTTETIEITKNYLFLRGPGPDFQFIPTSTTAPTIKINAVGVEVSSLVVETAGSGGQNAIEISTGADEFLLASVRIVDAQNDGINVSGTVTHGDIQDILVEDAGGDGIHIDGNIQHIAIRNTEIEGCGGNGIYFSGTTVSECSVAENIQLYTNAGYGIRVDAPATRIFVNEDVHIYDNTTGDILDNGTSTQLSSYVETGVSDRSAMRRILSALAGKLSGASTTSIIIRDVNDTTDRITATVDADGNRLAVTYDDS